MPEISPEVIRKYFEAGDQSRTLIEKGRAWEDLVCYLFEQVPGVSTSILILSRQPFLYQL